MAFQRKTLRNFTPLAREIAEAINDCNRVERRLKRLLEHIMPVELDAQALRNRFPNESRYQLRERQLRSRDSHNKGHQTLAELDDAFHDPAPIERKALGE